MNDITKSRASKLTYTQKEAMVDFMELNPQLRSGKFTKEFTTKMAEKLWHDLSEFLNALPGGQKDASKWRKTWQDLKTTVKEKAAKNLKESNLTGGGKGAVSMLSELEKRVSSLIGDANINGHIQIQESVVEMNWERSIGCAEKSSEHPILNIPDNEDEIPRNTFNSTAASDIIELPNSSQQSSPAKSSPLNIQSSSRMAQETHRRPSASISSSQYLASLSTSQSLATPSTSQSLAGSRNSQSVTQQSLSSNLRANRRYRLSSNQNGTQQRPSANSSLDQPSRTFTNRAPQQRPASVSNSKRSRIGVQRLENTIEASDKLVEAIHKKIEIKDRYYKAKLELMEKNLSIQDCIVKSLEDIVSAMNRTPDLQ